MKDHTSPAISVLVANARGMAAELISKALHKQRSFAVVACSSTLAETVERFRSLHPEVVLISSSLKDGPYSGFAALRQIRTVDTEAKAVMLLDSLDPASVLDAFRVGARGVLSPVDSDFKSLCKCILRVHQGQIWAESKYLTRVLSALSEMAPLRVVDATGIELLSKREEETVRLLAQGLTNREIAREMNLSEHTVKNYMFRIFDKLGVSTRVELVLYAVSASNPATEMKRKPSCAIEPDIAGVV